jgi:hypothetical protein
LPLEFAGVSSEGRVTLIIDEDAKPVPGLWAYMPVNGLHETIDSLKTREGTRKGIFFY